MGKRARSDHKGPSKKKYRVVSSIIDPNTSGIYATCARRHEKQALQELMSLLQDKTEEYYSEELKEQQEGVDQTDAEEDEGLSIEEQIEKELEQARNNTSLVDPKRKKPLLQQIPLECECMIFVKTRKPIEPEFLVLRMVEDLARPDNLVKNTRYIQKLTPVTSSCNATLSELEKLCERVLPSHFHCEGIPPCKFAIEVTRRNFNTLDKMDMINLIAREVRKGGKFSHTVELKKYDKLVLVQCFKNNIAMSVVDASYRETYRKYNIQEIFDAKHKKDEESASK